jgi:hypothetical protein
MTRNTKREIECLQRLQELTPVYEELLQFFTQQLLITNEELKVIRDSPEQAKLLQRKLATLSKERKLQLMEYEWTILPVERIKLTMVADNGHREITAEV